MSGWKRARCALAMHVEFASPAIELVLLDLAGVVRNVVEQSELGARNDFTKSLTCEMRENLPIGERAIDRCTHCVKVALTDLGSARKRARDRRA